MIAWSLSGAQSRKEAKDAKKSIHWSAIGRGAQFFALLGTFASLRAAFNGC
jgi:hypothetical protein